MSNFRLGITGSLSGGGLPHFTNWDNGLNSIKYKGQESIDSKSPSSFLSDYTFYNALGQPKKIEFGAADVKVLDNIAAVSYPEYTDIVKSVYTISPSQNDYLPLIGLYQTDGVAFDPGVVILPIFDFSFIEEFNLLTSPASNRIRVGASDVPSVDLDGLFIVIEYQGDASNAIGSWETIDGLADQKQILRWCPPGFYLDGQDSIDPDGYIPPGYFSIRKLQKLKYSSCDTNCDLENMYVLVANIGFAAKSFYSTQVLSCNPYASESIQPPIPPVQIPDIIDEQTFSSFTIEQETSLFSSFDWQNYQEKTDQVYGVNYCYLCVEGDPECGVVVLLPGQTCADLGANYYATSEECEYIRSTYGCNPPTPSLLCYTCTDAGCLPIYVQEGCESCTACGAYETQAACEAVCNVDAKICYECVNGECFATTLDGRPCESCEECNLFSSKQNCETLCFDNPPPPPTIKCNCCSLEPVAYSQEGSGFCQEREFPNIGLPCEAFCEVCDESQLGFSCNSVSRCNCCLEDWDGLKSYCLPIEYPPGTRCEDVCKACDQIGASCSSDNPQEVICDCCVDSVCSEVKYPAGTNCNEVCQGCDTIGSICEISTKFCNCCSEYTFGNFCAPVLVPSSVDCSSFCSECDPDSESCVDDRVICQCCIGDGINARCEEVKYPAGTICSEVCNECFNVNSICSNDGSGSGGDDCPKGTALSYQVKASEITLVKYKPAIECGKVDIYNKIQGKITASSSGVYTSNNHNLSYKDEIKLFDSTINKNLNGLFYIGEIVNENSFRLYKEESLITPIVESVSQNISWIKTSNKSTLPSKTINGIVVSAGSNTLSSAGHSWTTDSLVNYKVKIVSGTGEGQVRTITANTSNVLTLSSGWSTLPNPTALEEVKFEILCGDFSSWNYFATVISPRGRNGYGVVLSKEQALQDDLSDILLSSYQTRDFISIKKHKLSVNFNRKNNFDEIFIEDHFSDLSDLRFIIPNEFYIWNHIRDLRDPNAVKLASILDIYTMFPVLTRAIRPNKNIFKGRPTDSYNNRLNITDFKNNGKILPDETPDYGIGDLWNSAYNIVNSFRFGSSIDLKKTESGNYYLVVGDRGSETVISTSGDYPFTTAAPTEQYQNIHPWYGNAPVFTNNVYYQLPQYAHGAAFLFDISSDANDNADNLSIDNWYTAYTGDASVAKPLPLTVDYSNETNQYNFNIEFFSTKDLLPITIEYRGSFIENMYSRLKSAIKNSISKCSGNIKLYNNQSIFEPLFDFNNIETQVNHAHWYKGFVFGLQTINGVKDWIVSQEEDNCYFSDLAIPTIESSSQLYSNPALQNKKLNVGFYRNTFSIYPYVDSFGKTVALDMVAADKYVFAASRIKPYIFRPGAGDASVPGQTGSDCRNSLLSACNCGYVFVFKNNSKIQEIFDETSFTTILPSRSWVGQYYKAEKFAQTIVVKNSKLYWGQSKPVEISTEQVGWNYETSRILVFAKTGDIYNLDQTIDNHNDRFIEYQTQCNYPDLKQAYLRNELDDIYLRSGDDIVYYYPSDRFGDYFRVDNETLVTNAFDNQNELGDTHRQVRLPYSVYGDAQDSLWTEFNRTQDYLHVYKSIDNQWIFSQKIAPSFNYSDSKFRYFNDNYLAKVPNSIRSINNISYDNLNDKSLTWDIDLTGRFDVVDNRIILKDPISVSIFSENFFLVDKNELSSAVDTSFKTIYLEPYFTYTEDFNSDLLVEEGLCNIEFDRISSLYSYDLELSDKSQVIYRSVQEQDGDIHTKITTPVFFVNIPRQDLDYYSIQQLTIIVDEIPSNIANPKLKLVLYKKDPRQTIYPYYSDDSSTCLPVISSARIKSRKNASDFIPYRGGASDAALYELDSFRLNNNFSECEADNVQGFCLAKIIEPTESIIAVDNRKSNEYTINLDDLDFSLNDFIIRENLISTNTRTFGARISEQLALNDLSSIGYDSSIAVQESLIIGFVFQSENYGFDTATNPDYQSQISISKIAARVRYSNSNAGEYSRHLRNYYCVSTDVIQSDTNNKVLNFYENRNHYARDYQNINPEIPVLKYTRPAIGIAQNNLAPAINDLSNVVVPGAYSAGYSVVSVDDAVFSQNSSFDIQRLEYLSLFMVGGALVQEYETATLNMSGPLSSTANSVLFVDGSGLISDSRSLIISGPEIYTGARLLVTKSSLASFGACTLLVRSENENANNATLTLKGLSPRFMPLFVEAPKSSKDISSLFISSFYEENSTSLFVKPNVEVTLESSLFLKSDISTADTELYIAGPILNNESQDLFLKTYDIDNRSMNLYMVVPSLHENGMRLRMPKISELSDNEFSLFISTTTLNSLPLYLKTLDPEQSFGSTTASIYGSVATVNPLSETSNLFLLGKSDLFKFSENESPLFINGPDKAGVVSFASLYIGNIWYNNSGLSTLHTGGNSSGSNVPIGQVPSETMSLVLNSSYVDQKDSTLFINSTQGGDFIPLFLKSNQDIKISTLFVDATYGQDQSLTLVVGDAIGSKSEDTFVYINGFRR
jgi:hypothetical protein